MMKVTVVEENDVEIEMHGKHLWSIRSSAFASLQVRNWSYRRAHT